MKKQEFSLQNLPKNIFIDKDYLEEIYTISKISNYNLDVIVNNLEEFYNNTRTKIFPKYKCNGTPLGFIIINLDSIIGNKYVLEILVPTKENKGFVIGSQGSNLLQLKNDINRELKRESVFKIIIK
ncbi:hypothetical protein [Aliarcobacter butzleri]|uniref:hypothetical protein n=1 Tax=Aliarcobacter butzleri TaxID=28197 RepID=UPI001269CECF|nr:hypothetical protein [Aliarcobacter butzleri]